MSIKPNPRDPAELPRRALMPILIPCLVALCTVLLLAWSVWPVFQPNRSIDVTQALFVADARAEDPSVQRNTRSTRVVQAAGWLESEPFITAATALTDGIIEEMLVLEGDRVDRGEPLARMVDEDASLMLDRARADLARAEGARAEAEASLVAARQRWEEPYELENAVASAKASLDERRAELAQLPSLIRVEESLLTQAREEFEQIEEAYQSSAAAEIEYVTARELASAQAARLNAVRSREPILLAVIERLQADHHAASRAFELRIDDRARLDRARAALSMSESEVDQRRAVVREAELELERMTIRAPISGYVQRRLKAPGDKVVRMMDSPHSAHIAHLYDPSKLQVRVDVPLADAAQIFVGQRCEVVVEVLPDRTFAGEVLIVTHEADLQKNTLQIKVRVIDPDPVLRPEMLTRVRFLPEGVTPGDSETSAGAGSARVRILRDAMETVDGVTRVWVISERSGGRGVLRPVPVSLARSDREDPDGAWVTVSGPIHPGSVIAKNPLGCTPGERVRLRVGVEDTEGGAS